MDRNRSRRMAKVQLTPAVMRTLMSPPPPPEDAHSHPQRHKEGPQGKDEHVGMQDSHVSGEGASQKPLAARHHPRQTGQQTDHPQHPEQRDFELIFATQNDNERS